MAVSSYDRDDIIVKGATTAAYGVLSVGTSAVEVKVGGSALATRQVVHLFAEDNAIYWGYDASVTTSTGTRIFKSQFVKIRVQADQAVYVIADGASKSMRIGELG